MIENQSPETLPAVSVKVDGALAIVSNLPAFGESIAAHVMAAAQMEVA